MSGQTPAIEKLCKWFGWKRKNIVDLGDIPLFLPRTDDEYLIEREPFVTHYDVVLQTWHSETP